MVVALRLAPIVVEARRLAVVPDADNALQRWLVHRTMARDPVKTANLKAVAADHVTGSAATCEYKYYGPYDPRAREAESRERTHKGRHGTRLLGNEGL